MTVHRDEGISRRDQALGAAFLVLIGVGWSIAWALVPSTFSWYGFMGDCGAPAVDAVSMSRDPLAQHCQHVGVVHVTIGAVIGLVVVTGGLLALLISRSSSPGL